jgi:hypothetical protein
MSSGEKKIAVVLVVVLVAMVGVYFATAPKAAKPAAAVPMMAMQGAPMGGPSAAQSTSGGAACATGPSGGGAAKTQEFGKPGAKLEVVAIIPVAHGCHANSEATLKKAYQQHPKDIHLTIVDLNGPDAAKYRSKAGGVQWTVIAINGKYQFDLDGRRVALERAEGQSYRPADLIPIIEQQLKAT